MHAISPEAAARRAGWRPFLAPALVAVVAVATFAAALGSGFVWDDLAFLPPSEKLLQASDPREFFREGIWAYARIEVPAQVPLFRPVTTLFVWVFARVLGGSTVAWHLLPIALHMASAVLVYALARRWTPAGGLGAPLAAGLLFAALPCHAEAVAYVSGWGNPFTTLLALLAVHAQLSHSRGGAPGWLAAGVAAATLAALSSEGALVIPPLLAALDWVERRRASPTVWIGYALSVALPLYLRSRALSSPIPLQISAEALLRAASFGVAYVRDLVSPWPPPPHGSYPRSGVAGPATWAFVLALGAGVAWLVARLPARERLKPLMGLTWIVAGLAPITAAGMNATPFYAPRALYLPSVGLALLVAALLSSWTPTRRPWLRWAAAAAVLGGVAVGNAAAVEWRDEATVLRRMLQVDPEAPVVHLRLADLAEKEGRAEDSLRHVQAAVRYAVSARDRLDARERLAVSYGSTGRLDEAERLLAEVLREDPSRFRAWMNLGNVALSRGDANRARDCYERALRLSPRFGDAAFNLSLALDALGDPAGAAAARRQAAALGVGAR